HASRGGNGPQGGAEVEISAQLPGLLGHRSIEGTLSTPLLPSLLPRFPSRSPCPGRAGLAPQKTGGAYLRNKCLPRKQAVANHARRTCPEYHRNTPTKEMLSN